MEKLPSDSGTRASAMAPAPPFLFVFHQSFLAMYVPGIARTWPPKGMPRSWRPITLFYFLGEGMISSGGHGKTKHLVTYITGRGARQSWKNFPGLTAGKTPSKSRIDLLQIRGNIESIFLEATNQSGSKPGSTFLETLELLKTIFSMKPMKISYLTCVTSPEFHRQAEVNVYPHFLFVHVHHLGSSRN